MRSLRPVIATLALALAVATPTALVAPSSSADDATAVVKTRLKASADAKWIAAGESVTITGLLTAAGAPAVGQTVTLTSKVPAHKGPKLTETAVTDELGAVTFTVAPTARSIYKLKFDGTAELTKSSSKRIVVHLKKPTEVTATAVERGKKASVITGRAVAKAGTVKAKKVALQQRTDKGWVKLAAGMTNRQGRVQFVVTENGDFRLVFPGSTRLLPSKSRVLTLA